MDEIPESQFGLKDIIAIGLSVILFFVYLVIIPEQRWITDSPEWLLVTKFIISGLLTLLSWFALTKWLIPSNEELIDLDVKRKIAGGIKEIKEDAAEIKSLGYKLKEEYSSKTISLGETIERIMILLDHPDLVQITKIEGKLFRFVNLLKEYEAFESGAKRMNPVRFKEFKKTFESALELAIIAMDNLEYNLNDKALSKAQILEQTLEDLFEIDGLLTPKDQRNQTEELKRSTK